MDIISVAVLLFYVGSLMAYVVTRDVYYISLCIASLIVDITTKIIKIQTGGDGNFGRPNVATNCDIFCRNGPVGGAPGFPSGHMAVTAFFLGALAIRYRSAWILLGIIPMALARYHKGCHTWIQIFAGTLLGFVSAIAFHRST